MIASLPDTTQHVSLRTDAGASLNTSPNELTPELRIYLAMMEQTLATQLNLVRKLLDKNPKRCKQCGNEIK